jgi:hypothetical protein
MWLKLAVEYTVIAMSIVPQWVLVSITKEAKILGPVFLQIDTLVNKQYERQIAHVRESYVPPTVETEFLDILSIEFATEET